MDSAKRAVVDATSDESALVPGGNVSEERADRGDPSNDVVLDAVAEQIDQLRKRLIAAESQWAAEIAEVHESNRSSAVNLAHYWAIRQTDLRDLQQQLAAFGLSSLGRCEPHVQATLDAIATTADTLAGHTGERRDAVAGFVDGPRLRYRAWNCSARSRIVGQPESW